MPTAWAFEMPGLSAAGTGGCISTDTARRGRRREPGQAAALIRNALSCLSTGSTLYIARSPQTIVRDIESFRPTILVLVPAQIELLLKLSKTLGRNVFGQELRDIVCGASALAPYLAEECHKLGINLIYGYGLTEAANLVSGNGELLNKPGSIGLPFPEQEMKLEGGEHRRRGRPDRETHASSWHLKLKGTFFVSDQTPDTHT